MLLTDQMTYLPNDLLVKVDIATMAVSLEARSPFLDHHVIEFAASLPQNLKLRRLTSKYLLKKVLRKLLPTENLNRRKMGFGVPIGHWFRGKMQPFLREVVLSDKALRRGLFKPEAVRQLIDLHVRGERDHSHQLWTLLMLELWFNRFIDLCPHLNQLKSMPVSGSSRRIRELKELRGRAWLAVQPTRARSASRTISTSCRASIANRSTRLIPRGIPVLSSIPVFMRTKRRSRRRSSCKRGWKRSLLSSRAFAKTVVCWTSVAAPEPCLLRRARTVGTRRVWMFQPAPLSTCASWVLRFSKAN